MKPIEARTFNQICSLKRDNMSTKDFWLQLDVGIVTLAKQRNGEPCEASMRISRKQFDRIVQWYVNGGLRRPSTSKEAK